PDMAMDWESWWDFERRAVALIASASPLRALEQLHAIIERVRSWRPGAGTLIDRVTTSFESESRPHEAPQDADELRMRHYLAAHAFANWTAHLGLGLRTWLRSIEAAHRLARERGFSAADLELRHMANPKELSATWSRVEDE